MPRLVPLHVAMLYTVVPVCTFASIATLATQFEKSYMRLGGRILRLGGLSGLTERLIPQWNPANAGREQPQHPRSSIKSLLGWPPEQVVRETAWLDGLRGVAAFLVMTYHLHLLLFYGLSLEAPYGATV